MKPGAYLAKVFYASPGDMAARIPELYPLRNRRVALFGVGCLGAPISLELARAGIAELRIVDRDTVDPCTTVRWPFGLSAAGQGKAEFLGRKIGEEYPYTQTKSWDWHLGRVRQGDSKSDQELLAEVTRDVDLICDTTAEIGVQLFLSEYAWENNLVYVGVCGTRGGWGGKVFRFRPERPGCLFCYRTACAEEGGIPEPPAAPAASGEIQPTGCADPTFTGAGFDMLEVALAGARTVVSTLCEGKDQAYPAMNWDATHIGFRDDEGNMIPACQTGFNIPPHPDCRRCNDR